MEKELLDVFDLQTLKEQLTHHRLKATSQRLVIYQSLLKNDDHPSAENIYDLIRVKHPSISLATVYKTMDALVAAGLAKKVKTGDDLLRFDAKTGNHSHLYCSNTNQIIDFEDEELQAMLEGYFARKKFKNFKVTDFQLQINGEIKDKDKNIKLKQFK
jgi:Fur family peroxide stress response transcriptional regulator